MIPALLNASLLLVLSGIHIYWAVGGKWGAAVAVPDLPQKAGAKAFSPGPIATLAVAVGLASMAGLHLHKIGWLPVPLPDWLDQYGLMLVGGIFFLRVIGDFRYVGYFKRITDTAFAKMDTALYIPLCLVISICAFWTAVLP
jgi:hypothetical protein